MTDVELTRGLERCELSGFHHADHLRVGLVYLREASTITDAIGRMAGALRQFAARAGVPGKYSQSTTEFWMYQLAAVRAMMPGATADEIFAAYPWLLDKNLVRAA